jgi:predicted transcriptional regulator of viral defense system
MYMKFDTLIEMTTSQPFFDLATAVHLSGEERAHVRTQLYRWTKSGKVLPLRRGVYTLADRYRKVPVNPAELANHIYRPSYLSGLWALGFYGLIPERVVTHTSVTTRVPRRFENTLGLFEYRHVKQSAFFGYRSADIQASKVMLADPEKALLDLWHLGKGEWCEERMEAMRFQNRDAVDRDRLERYAGLFESPRLLRAVKVWSESAEIEREGTAEL